MSNYKMFLLLAMCSVLISGCTQYWYQEGATYEQCLRDREECFSELQKRTDFLNTGNYEFEFMAQCMRQKGYELVTEKKLPMDVKRTEPETSLHWRIKGLAGMLERP
ncbi:MAG: hypothetical protein ABFR90_06495 [Planctomycetota bacterium]